MASDQQAKRSVVDTNTGVSVLLRSNHYRKGPRRGKRGDYPSRKHAIDLGTDRFAVLWRQAPRRMTYRCVVLQLKLMGDWSSSWTEVVQGPGYGTGVF